MRLFLCLLYLLTSFLFPTRLVARLGPLPGTEPVKPIFDKADVVCSLRVELAKIVRLQGGGTDGALQDFVRVTGTILDVYKSDLTPPGSLVFQFPEDPMSNGATGFREGDVVLLFLTRGDSVYDLADPFIGVIYFSRLDRVPGNPDIDKLESALALALRRGNRDDQINAMRLLEGFDQLSPTTLSTVSGLSSSSDPAIAFAALAVLLKTRTPDSVAKFLSYLQNYKEDQPPIGLISAADELGLVTDVGALPEIELLSNNRFISVQMAAMDAIRRIASRTSAPTLMRRLDDPNRNVQYSALITLAELFGKSGDYGPSAELFDKRPAYYTALWKKWWQEDGKKQYGSLDGRNP